MKTIPIDWLCYTSNIWKVWGKWERGPWGICQARIDSSVTKLPQVPVDDLQTQANRYAVATPASAVPQDGAKVQMAVSSLLSPNWAFVASASLWLCLSLWPVPSSCLFVCLFCLHRHVLSQIFPVLLSFMASFVVYFLLLPCVSVFAGKTWPILAVSSLFFNLLPHFHWIYNVSDYKTSKFGCHQERKSVTNWNIKPRL